MATNGVNLSFPTLPTSKKGQVDAGEKQLDIESLKVTPGALESPPAKPRTYGYGENDSFKDSQPKKDWNAFSGGAKVDVDPEILEATNRMFEKQLLGDIEQSLLDLSDTHLDDATRSGYLDGLSEQLNRLVGPLKDPLGVRLDQTGKNLQIGSSIQLDEDQRKKLEGAIKASAKEMGVRIPGFEYYSGSEDNPIRYAVGADQPPEAPSKFKRFISG